MSEQNLEEFVDRYLLDKFEVKKYTKARKFPLVLLMIFLLGAHEFAFEVFLSPFQLELFVISVPVEPIIKNQMFKYPLWIFAVFAGPVSIVLFIYVANYEMSQEDIAYHYLSVSIDNYIEGDVEDAVDNLQKFVNSLPSFPELITKRRKQLMKKYVSVLKDRKSADELEEVLDDTFEPIMSKTTSEIMGVDDDESLRALLENAEPDSVDEPTIIEILKEAFDSVISERVFLGIQMSIFAVAGIALAFRFGVEWGVLFITICAIYLRHKYN